MCTRCIPQIDATRAEAFADRMLGVLNSGAIAIMVSIGHRTGLFDAMAEVPPTDSHGIAAKAGLNERYVREWLGAMVTGGIVHYDPKDETYRLPAEHAACLTRSAAPNNVAAFAQYIPQLGSVEDRIVECFRNGGGVPYEAFVRFHDIMAEDSGQTVLPALLESILPLVPGLTERLEAGIQVLDVGCGSGLALALMAEAFPESRFTGYDFSEEGIRPGRTEAKRRGLTNLRFEVKDAATIDEVEVYDLITTFDAVHDQAKPAKVLKNIYQALRPDGVYLMQDIAGSSQVQNNMDHPMGPLLYTVSCMHCMTVSLAQGGDGLGAMWGEEKACEMLAEAGFQSVQVERLPHDVQNSYFIIRKSPEQAQRAA
jgi:2-polyprenyl-3-methyl-5-hydroxy-6-metoxy-1,4-benzoquinol methylase